LLTDDLATPDGSTAEAGIPSPLALLSAEEAYGDGQAREALFLSYTANLCFFESTVLGVTQACGALITVVGDASMATLDPRAVRRGGRSYLPGLAACAGAFHPKMMVVVGPERATMAIGSGNLTLAGWQANSELWTVLKADTERCPIVFDEIAQWLRTLGKSEHVRFSDGAPQAFNRVADQLDGLIAGARELSDPDVRLVSTSNGPIVMQLPSGPVDELAVCAPFFGPGSLALRALVRRLRPERLIVTYQPGMTQLDGPSLAALAAEVSTEIRQDDEMRYRHGKLIEWAANGQRFALTGSPNLTAAALLQGLADGGNVEVGLITPVAVSLLPTGGLVLPSAVRVIRLAPQERSESGPLLLGASQVDGHLHIVFARPTTAAGYVELSPVTAPPESWERIAALDAGTAEFTVGRDAEGGSRVRLVTPTANGTSQFSNVVLVVDTARVLRRPGAWRERVPSAKPEGLFLDPKAAEQFLAALAELSSDVSPSVSERAPGGQRASDLDRRKPSGSPQTWDEYLDKCAGRVGQPLLRFALGLPSLPTGNATLDSDMLRVPWDEQFADDTEAGLDDDTAEDVSEETGTGADASVTSAPDLSTATDHVRRRYRRWATRLAEARYTAVGRLARVRCLLLLIAAGAWDEDSTGWFPSLAESVRVLPHEDRLHDEPVTDPTTDELPVEAEPQAASLAAIGLSVLRAHAPRYAGTSEALSYRRAARAVAHLLPAAELDLIDEYSKHLGDALGFAVLPETVLDIAAEVVQDDPLADGIRALAEIGKEAHTHGASLLHVTGRFGNPVLAALDAIGTVQDMALVGSWATSETGRWALLVWHRPDLVVIDATRPERPLWRHHLLDPTLTPKVLAAQRSLERAPQKSHGPQILPFQEGEELLRGLGLSSPAPPVDCRG